MSQFEEIRLCKLCNGEVKENHHMEHSYCTNCSIIEPDEKVGFWCKDCEEICLEEKCNCIKSCMTGELIILKDTEKAFKRFCQELDIDYRCIGEGIDGDKFEVTFDFISDIYALGKMVGIETMHEFNTKQTNENDN